MLGEASGTRVASVAARISDRKRIRKAEEEGSKALVKRSKGVIKLRESKVDSPGFVEEVAGKTPDGGPGKPIAEEAFSATRAADSAKSLLDQVCLFLLCDVVIGPLS